MWELNEIFQSSRRMVYYVNWHTLNTNIYDFLWTPTMTTTTTTTTMIKWWMMKFYFSGFYDNYYYYYYKNAFGVKLELWHRLDFESVMHWCHVNVINDVYSFVQIPIDRFSKKKAWHWCEQWTRSDCIIGNILYARLKERSKKKEKKKQITKFGSSLQIRLCFFPVSWIYFAF